MIVVEFSGYLLDSQEDERSIQPARRFEMSNLLEIDNRVPSTHGFELWTCFMQTILAEFGLFCMSSV
jgi:hypothetical protein